MPIKTNSLSIYYPNTKKPALCKINLEIKRGRCNLFIGKSGSGKTTLLRCLAKLMQAPEGSVSYSGSFSTGFVSQGCDLFPHMTALDNCIHPQKQILKKSTKEAKENAAVIFDLLDLKEHAHKYPHQLSGGQKQRTAIARALGMNIQVLFLDEPTSALDPKSTQQFHKIMEKLLSEGLTVVISTHDTNLIQCCLDMVYLLEEGELIASFDAKVETLLSSPRIHHYIKPLA